MKIPMEIRALIEAGTPAHLVTLNPDGSPQVTVVWIGLDGDEIVSGHLPRNRKVRNIENDPRVAISLETDTKSAMGLDRIRGPLWTRPHPGRRWSAAPAEAGVRVHGARCQVPAHGEPTARLRHAHSG